MAESGSGHANESIALMFPGQGSQFPGMGADLVRESATARALMERADDILGYALSKIMLEDRKEELDRTVYTQPAIFVHSMILLELMRERREFTPSIASGHSLGEYSALCAAGVLSFEDALKLIQVRARGMDQAQPAGVCGMAALIGPSKDEALEIIDACRGDHVLEAANFNAPDQTVVSGHLEAVGRVIEAARDREKTRGVKLPVSSAFHTSLMDSAKQSLSEELGTVALKSPQFTVVANHTGEPYPSTAGGKELLIEQIVNPVLWVDCVRTMLDQGSSLFIEVGPGKVLTGLLRRTDRKARAVSVSDMYGIYAFEGVVQ